MNKYIDIEVAIGRLVLGGIVPQLVKGRNAAGTGLVCRTTGAHITPAFRDGATYKVKASDIDDAIEHPEAFDLVESIIDRS